MVAGLQCRRQQLPNTRIMPGHDFLQLSPPPRAGWIHGIVKTSRAAVGKVALDFRSGALAVGQERRQVANGWIAQVTHGCWHNASEAVELQGKFTELCQLWGCRWYGARQEVIVQEQFRQCGSTGIAGRNRARQGIIVEVDHVNGRRAVKDGGWNGAGKG